MSNGIIIVDHGSRRGESNRMLETVAGLFAARFRERYAIVEPAHMELAEPSIATAYARCVERGATRVIVCPFFLGPGKHWTSDIPRLAADAALNFPQTRYHVAQTLGIDDLILDLLAKRVGHCEQHAFGCDACRGTLRSGESGVTIPPAAERPHEPASAQCTSCPFVVHQDGTITDKRKPA
ncbi:MAG TPA: CbiX/SirB N-terminal domain-containing protein, partial [Tepidisphaeraceae bacterium]|nr:CbiX/SirB N-terminal domain-containing protein [Tepidisphaeraceae bacterium]